MDSGRMTVLIDVSNKCNLRCRMCYFSFDSVFHRSPIMMTPETYRRVARKLLPGAHILYLSASSEPMMNPDFAEILRITSEYEVEEVKFLTNGLLMTPEISEAILENGVTQIHFSVDGATVETYEWVRRGGRFETLVENIEYLSRRKRELGLERPWLQFNVTLMQRNIEELHRFVDLAEEVGVQRIACRHLMPIEGLDIDGQVLAKDKETANRGLVRLVERAMRAPGVEIVNLPDFFADYPVDPLPPLAPAPGDRARSSEPGPRGGGRSNGGASNPRGADSRHAAAVVVAATAESGDDMPFGAFDRPLERELFGAPAIELAGWALARGGIERVVLKRSALPDDDRGALDSSGLVPLGEAHFQHGFRPDVAISHPGNPWGWRASWSFELQREALPSGEPLAVRVHAFAEDSEGRSSELGRRTIVWHEGVSHPPLLFCRKPFDNLYVDAAGDVYPYPDCQTVDPFGNLAEDASLESIWYGEAMTELRERIIERDPPSMCLTCPDFINRSVDDEAYFEERRVHEDFERPFGHLDRPADPFEAGPDQESVLLEGWSVGFEGLDGTEVLREALPEDPPDAVGADGLVLLGEATHHEGQRPDVAQRYRRYKDAGRAAWSFSVDRSALGGLGHGVLRIRVRVRARTGRTTPIGRLSLVFR